MVPEPLPPSQDVDLDAVADKVMASLAGQVPRACVERLLVDLLQQQFAAARVTQYLPIFLHRRACETLRLAPAADPADPRGAGR